jgi:hypothetical protein
LQRDYLFSSRYTFAKRIFLGREEGRGGGGGCQEERDGEWGGGGVGREGGREGGRFIKIRFKEAMKPLL